MKPKLSPAALRSLNKLAQPRTRTGNLLMHLLTRTTLVLVLGMGLTVGLVYTLLQQAGDRLQEEFLRRQAAELVAGLQDIPGGPLQLRLNNSTLNAYRYRREGYTFMVEDAKGRITLESIPMARVFLEPAIGLNPTRPTVMNTLSRDGQGDALYILTLPIKTPRGVYYLTVGQARTIDDALLGIATAQTFRSLLFYVGPLLLLLLGFSYLLLRNGLSPLYRLSGQVRRLDVLGGETLALDNVPRELRPMVESFNTLLTQLTRTLEAQKGLTADTAHQLKTPLAVLQARLEQLDDFKGKEMLAKDVQRMSRLVRQLLHYAVLSQHSANVQPTDLAETTRNVVASLFPLARQQGVTLDFIGPDEALTWPHDSGLLTEAISNLIDNAIRHSPKKGKVEVKLVAPEKNTTEGPRIDVCDRGPGIPPTERALVFTRFWQGPDVPTEGHHGGAGLGLALVAEVMRQHKGSASVHGRDGGGSIFRLQLPKGL